MGKLFEKLIDEYFHVPNFYTDANGNYRNAKVKIPFGKYDFGDPINIRFDFFDEKIFIDGKEATLALHIISVM